MGEFAILLREPEHRERLRLEGGEFWYPEPRDLGQDMVALKRSFPDAQLFAADDPLHGLFGYVGLLRVEDHPLVAHAEVTFRFQMHITDLTRWVRANLDSQDALQLALARTLQTAEGRRRFIVSIEYAARHPELEQDPEPEVVRRTLWERLGDDL